jgi:NADPH:quinone reductase-like Zn-dependent oxidoreductase
VQAGAQVIAGVRPGQFDTARALGASEVLAIGEAYAGEPFDHVADAVGGPDVAALCRHVKPGGRIRTVATDPIDPAGLPAVPEFFALHADAEQLASLVSLVATGEIPLSVAKRVPLAQAAEAHRLMESGGLGGKLVLVP